MLVQVVRSIRANNAAFVAHCGAALVASVIFAQVYSLQPVSSSVGALAIAFVSAAACCLFFSVIHIRRLGVQSCVPSLQGLLSTHALLFLFVYATSQFMQRACSLSESLSVFLSALMTSVASLLVARVWVFINPCIETVVYEEVPGDFYQDATDVEEVGGFRAWYHTGRYRELGSRVQSIYKTGDKVYDFGCGGAEWNSTKLPVVGVDVNRALLEMGMSKGQLSHMVIAELHKTGIPDQTADIVIISEVFEHLSDPAAVFAEIYRCLKPGGKLLVTVPWDTPCSLFFWVFNVQCFYRGYILGESYYRQRCGHINHFSGALLKKLMRRGGFKVEYLYRFRGFLLYSLASKNVVQL